MGFTRLSIIMSILSISGCRFGFDEVATSDAMSVDAVRTCAGDTLHVVPATGDAFDKACPWGCVTAGGAHCGGLAPTGGALATSDVAMQSGLGAVTLTAATTTFDGDAGTVDDGAPVAGFAFSATGAAAVFHVGSLLVASKIQLRGQRAIAIVVDGPLVVANTFTLRDCIPTERSPGGFAHGAGTSPLQGRSGSNSFLDGAGGGGNGGNGGSGTNAAGGAHVDAATFPLVGGGGGGDAGAPGGNGGGALQLVSNTRIVIAGSGTLDGCGCLGESGYTGGGGGAGATIVLEAPAITIEGSLTVDGGTGGTYGGAGGSWTQPNGQSMPPLGPAAQFGGGGGGIGRIRLATRPNALTIGGTASIDPPIGIAGSTTTARDAQIE